VQAAARKMGIERPLVWIECTPAAYAIPGLNAVGLIYQRTDRWEDFPGGDHESLRRFHCSLQTQADLTLFCSTLLFEQEQGKCRAAAYVDHGVDFEHFAAAGAGLSVEPAELRAIARPRVGFVGGIDAHTFDPSLFVEVARLLPDLQFVLVGDCSLPEGWCILPNVMLLGRRPYETIADYMAACDVLIMPWNNSEWIKACNPVKLKEYLAVGRPVVTTDFQELCRYEGCLRRAQTAGQFAAQIRSALGEPVDEKRLRERVREDTWAAKLKCVLHRLEELGLTPGYSGQSGKH